MSHRAKSFYVLPLVLGLSLLQAAAASAGTNNDFQQWSLIFVNHHLDDNWSASMQVENRLRDDASEVDKQVFKPGGYYGVPIP
jgi:ABC-type sugar transport system substrate-binding protein